MEASKLDRDRSKSPQFAGQKLPESKPPERGNNNLLLSKPAEQK
jgi:hypothetical protein